MRASLQMAESIQQVECFQLAELFPQTRTAGRAGWVV